MAGPQDQQGDRLGQAQTAEERLNWDIFDLDFSVRKSRRYHEKLAAFYGYWRDWVKIVTIVSGSGLFFLLMGHAKEGAEILAAFVAAWAMLDYMVGPDKKADIHHELCQQFIDLAIKIETMQHTRDAYAVLAAERLRLEKEEPPCKRLVDLQARNDECRARNFPPEDLVPLSGPQRFLGYFATFGMKRLENWKAERQRQLRAPA